MVLVGERSINICRQWLACFRLQLLQNISTLDTKISFFPTYEDEISTFFHVIYLIYF